MAKKIIIGTGLVLFIAVLAGVNYWKLQETRGLPVAVVAAKKENLEETVFVIGKLEAVDRMTVPVKIGSQVLDILVETGDEVTKDQLLIRLDNSEIMMEVKRAKANLAIQEANLKIQEANLAKATTRARPEQLAKLQIQVEQAEDKVQAAEKKHLRMQQLLQAGAIAMAEAETAEIEFINSKQEYRLALTELEATEVGPDPQEEAVAVAQVEQAQLQVQQALLQVSEAEEQLADAEIRAPMTGVVFSLKVSKGDYVNTGTALVELGQRNQIQIIAEVNEIDSGSLKEGAVAKINVPALRGEEFAGLVTKIAPVATLKTQDNAMQSVVEVTITLNDLDGKLKPGYSADVKLVTTSSPQALVVPYEAVVNYSGDDKAVWVVQDGKAYQTPVRTGISNELYIEIVQGLEVGDQVIVNPGEKLTDGMAVTPQNDDNDRVMGW